MTKAINLPKKAKWGACNSGWDKAPPSYMIYIALFMPHFCEGGAVLGIDSKNQRWLGFPLPHLK